MTLVLLVVKVIDQQPFRTADDILLNPPDANKLDGGAMFGVVPKSM